MSRSSEILGRVSSRDTTSPVFQGGLSDDGLNGRLLGSDSFRGARHERNGGDSDVDLKNLLLANLDLIQNQQEHLMANERTIMTLRRENEMLKSRLDRIERRMSLVYQKGFQHPATTTPLSDTHPKSEIRSRRGSNRKSNVNPLDLGNESFEKAENIKEESVHLADRDSIPVLEEARETVEGKAEVMPVSPRKSNSRISSGKLKAGKRHEEPEVDEVQKQPKLEDVSSKENKDKKREAVLLRRVRKDSEILKTETLYYVPPLYVDEADENDDKSRTHCEEQILVPSWRIKRLSSLYVMEGTENLDDRVFVKRHQKSETEEKRRKRWDIQRLKDLQLLRRQQLKNDAASNIKQEILTFLPQLEKASYIEVSDTIPVSVFGYPVPKVEAREFHLPWYNATKDLSNKNKRMKKT